MSKDQKQDEAPEIGGMGDLMGAMGNMDPNQMMEMLAMASNPDLAKENFGIKRFIEFCVLAYRVEHPLKDREVELCFVMGGSAENEDLNISPVTFNPDGSMSRLLKRWKFNDVFKAVSIEGLLASMKYIAEGHAKNWDHIKALITNQAQPEL